jgi:hypothetical protein
VIALVLANMRSEAFSPCLSRRCLKLKRHEARHAGYVLQEIKDTFTPHIFEHAHQMLALPAPQTLAFAFLHIQCPPTPLVTPPNLHSRLLKPSLAINTSTGLIV